MHLRVVCLLDWRLEVFYYPYYKIKNAGVHELNFIHPDIYYRTFLFKMNEGSSFMLKLTCDENFNYKL